MYRIPCQTTRMAPGPVNPRRRYDSPRRRAQAAATRREILLAAERLFAAHGFTATTMAAIAAEAGVAPRTVYVAFTGKSGVLRALWHLRLRGDEDDVPMGGRPWYVSVLVEADPARQLIVMAGVSRQVKERAGTLMEVIRSAAAADPDAAALWRRIGSEFHELLGGLAGSLDDKGALAPGLDRETAADLLWTLTHPDVWQLLVIGRGWTAARYEAWLTGALHREVLGLPPPAPVSSR